MSQSRVLAAQKGAVPSQTVAGGAEARHPEVLIGNKPSMDRTRAPDFITW